MHLSQRQLFLQHVAQTTAAPIGIEIERAEGVYLHGTNGEKYIDLISGIGVSNVGHCHPQVVKGIQDQAAKYMHLMVYGEYVYSPQVQLATALSKHLPASLSTCYFVNSGAEAIEGAIKLAKRSTGRTELISFKNAYHGSTHGALSIMGSETYKNAYRPLLPQTKTLNFNSFEELEFITTKTAAVIIETIQGEAGVITPTKGFLEAVSKRCNKVGALMISDEIQCGFGRTGTLFAFEQYNFIPDILCLAKGMGGGMPIGAFIASYDLMQNLTHNPILGHITTFGGNPVTCAASLATLDVITKTGILNEVNTKAEFLKRNLQHKAIKSIRNAGLMMAIQLDTFDNVLQVCQQSIAKGVIIDWFLFNDNSIRIAPPLTITEGEIKKACEIIIGVLDEVYVN